MRTFIWKLDSFAVDSRQNYAKMKKNILLLFFIGCLASISELQAQNLYPYASIDSIPVLQNGIQLQEPWSGGLNHAQFQMMDVDRDCLNDLVVFDRTNNALKIYINVGDSATPDYKYMPEYANYFPKDLDGIVFLKDYNNDGKVDVLTHHNFSLKYYKNVSDSDNLAFELIEENIKYKYGSNPWSPLYWTRGNTGAIEDVDGDGDLDIINFPVSWAGVELYENVSTHPDTLRFELTTRCWGMFAENALDSIVLNYSCKGVASSNNSGASRHSGGGISLFDIDNDGLLDVLYTDEGANDVKMMINGGDSNTAQMVSVEYNYPAGDVSVSMPLTPLTYFVDINNDGNPVMLAAPSSITGGQGVDHIWKYENTNPNGLAEFELVQTDFLVGDQIDVGSEAYPVFFDVNGDGLDDLLVGNKGYYDSTDIYGIMAFYTAKISYYENVGTAGAPSFQLITNDWLGMSAKGYSKMVPAFGDLNNDGVADMVVSQSNGYLSYYENTAPAGSPANFVLNTDSLAYNQYGPNFYPLLYDVDGDNMLDLVAGQKEGNIKVFLNMGDSLNPWFQTTITDTLGGVFNNNIYKVHNTANMAIGNLDGYNGNVLLTSTSSGIVKVYSGIDANPQGQFTLVDSLQITTSGDFGIGLGKLGTSDSLTLAIGELSGGVRLFELNAQYTGEASFYVCETPADTSGNPSDTTGNPGDTGTVGINQIINEHNFSVFPNPTNGQFQVAFTGVENQNVTLRVIDLGGKTLFVDTYAVSSNQTVTVHPSQLPTGMVIVEISTAHGKFYKRLAVQ